MPLAHHIAEVMAGLAAKKPELASSLVLRRVVRMDLTPGSIGARQVLRALAKDVLLRLNPGQNGRPEIVLTLVSQARELLCVPLFTTLTGRSVSARDLEALFLQNKGPIYGLPPGETAAARDSSPRLTMSVGLRCSPMAEAMGYSITMYEDGEELKPRIINTHRDIAC